MRTDRDVFGKRFLHYTQMWSSIVLRDKCINLFFCEQGENRDPIFGILIRSNQRKLVKYERRCLRRSQADSARLGHAKLLTNGFFDVLRSQRKCTALSKTTDPL